MINCYDIMPENGCVDFKLYKKIAVVMAILCLVTSIFLSLSFANLIQTQISGKGDLYIRQSSKNTVDIAGAKNATFVFNYNREWDSEKNVGSSEFILIGAKGTPEDQYIVKGKAAGHTVEYAASNIIDSFSGSRTFTIKLEDTGEDFDNLVLMRGNMTLIGKVRSADKEGKPEDLEDLFAKGELAIREYINVSSRKDPAEDWLGFCQWVEEKATERAQDQALPQPA